MMGSRFFTVIQKVILLIASWTIMSTFGSRSLDDDLKCCLADVVNSSLHLNCSGLNWTSVNVRCLLPSTEVLLLDNNNLTTLTNGTFSELSSLRSLSISSSNVKYIQPDAFLGLENLQSLNMDNNLLQNNINSISLSVFRHFSNLRELYLAENDIHFDSKTSHETDLQQIFSHLLNLTSLSLDGDETLNIGMEFKHLTQLYSLTIQCYNVKNVTNESFIGLWDLSLKELNLFNFYAMNIDPDDIDCPQAEEQFSEDAFQNLRSLQILRIYECRIGNQYMARKLKHFVNSSLHTVLLKTTHFKRAFTQPYYTVNDSVITKETMKYLNQIKLQNFAWVDSGIFAIAPGTVSSSVWRYHLKRLDLSGNDLGWLGYRESLYELSRLEKVEEVVLASTSASENEIFPPLILPPLTHPQYATKTPLTFPYGGSSFRYSHRKISFEKMESANTYKDQKRMKQLNVANKGNNILDVLTLSQNLLSHYGYYENSQNPSFPGNSGNWTLRLPPSLKVFRYVKILHDVTNFNSQNFKCIQSSEGSVNLTHFYFIGNGIFRGTGRLMGFINLQLLDMSENGLIVENYFFDDFPKLRYLILQSIMNEDFIQRIPIDRLIHNLPELKYLDLSNNKLNFLPRNLFSRNPHVSHVILSKNRFASIPLTVSSIPNLIVLDLSGNAIPYLDDQVMTSLTIQRNKVAEMYVSLAQNNIACVCSQIHFLYWLNTSDFVDNMGNYSCTSEDGQLTNTGVLIQDLMGYYRHCSGYYNFLLTFVLFLLMSFIFLTAYILHRFRKSIEAFMVRIFVKAFRPMKSTDYRIHVFIGYADDDISFVRNILVKFLEQDLRVSTFIHQRDLGPGYTDQQMFEAIRDSWRILLVITGQFLNNYDMSDIVMKFASHSVSPANQGRVVALVQDTQLHNIPGYLYDVLDDSRIIVFSSLTSDLDYEQIEKIKQSLRDD